jgi:hypothetical protein
MTISPVQLQTMAGTTFVARAAALPVVTDAINSRINTP